MDYQGCDIMEKYDRFSKSKRQRFLCHFTYTEHEGLHRNILWQRIKWSTKKIQPGTLCAYVLEPRGNNDRGAHCGIHHEAFCQVLF